MPNKHNEDGFMFGVSSSMRYTQEKPASNGSHNQMHTHAQPSKTWHLCPFFVHNPRQNVHCLSLTMFRQGDVEQHLARCHWFICPRCKEPFNSAMLLDKHTYSEPHCVPREMPDGKSIEKALKKKLLEYRERQDKNSRTNNLYKHLFGEVSKTRLRFSFPPILLPVYYAVTAIIFLLFWASLISLNRRLSIGLSPKFIYELLMAFSSLDSQSAHLLTKLTIKTVNAQLSQEGLSVSVHGMLQQVFRILDTNSEDATTHGALMQDFKAIGAVVSGRVRKVLEDNPEQRGLIIDYLERILRDNNYAFDQAHQTEPNTSESQHDTPDYDHMNASDPGVFDGVWTPMGIYDDTSMHDCLYNMQDSLELEEDVMERLMEDIFQAGVGTV